MPRPILAWILTVAALPAAGCRDVAHFIWPCTPARCPGAATRETPEAAVDYLIDAFKDRRVGDLYESLHPAFRAENGAFTDQEFSLAYDHFESEFEADARNLAAAKRVERGRRGDVVFIDLDNAQTGAFFPIALENRPKIRLVTKNPFVPTIEGPVDVHALVRVEGGRLRMPADFDLTSIAGVTPEMVEGLKTEDIVSVELTDNWLVRSIDRDRARNIRFLDKIKEYATK